MLTFSTDIAVNRQQQQQKREKRRKYDTRKDVSLLKINTQWLIAQ
jgi:hypothetical protein